MSLRRSARRRLLAAAAVLALAASFAWRSGDARAAPVLSAYPAGLLGNENTVVALAPSEAYRASYVPGSDVLELPDGRWRYVPAAATAPVTVPAGDRDARASVHETRSWLAEGRVPGSTARERHMAARALLDMRLLTRPNGAVAAAWHGAWKYSWPRDASFVAAAFAVTGHADEAYEILTYNAKTQRGDGTWEARTLLDGSGPPDDRHWQLDANGWVPWAVWEWFQAAPGKHRHARARVLYPMVRKAADYAAGSLDARGLPPAGPDYWEIATDAPNIGTAAPLLSGLRASADLARRLGHPGDARRWLDAARRLADGIKRTFGRNGYQRTVEDGSGSDSAVTFMAPPFNPADALRWADIGHTFSVLRRRNGGVVPGESWSGDTTWTPETMFFALAGSGTGHGALARELVHWLSDHRTSLGALPEQIDQAGDPYSVAPLAWTDALLLMTLTQLDGNTVPVPPAPCDRFGGRVLILDEPTSALGVKQAGVVLKHIAKARDQGIAVILITHNPAHAHLVADRFVLLNKGRCVARYRRDEVSRNEVIQTMAGGAELDELAHELKSASAE